MSEWRETRLGDVCQHITVGHVGKMSDQYTDDGVCFLRSQDVRPFRVDLQGAKRVAPDFHRRLRKSALQADDVVVVRTGYPGTAAVIPPDAPELNCADLVVIRPGPTLDPWFVASHFNSTHGRASVSGSLVGSAQQHFNVGVAADTRLLLPPLRIQSRVAGVLRAFDELIEINERRIELLEDLARSLYREWFVRFRFPGHEDTKFVDSELGPMPEEWGVLAAGSALLPVGGGTPSKKRAEYWSAGSIPWFTPSDLTRGRRRHVVRSETAITPRGLAESGAKVFPAGSVLMTSRATLGVLAIAEMDSTCNQGFIVIPPTDGIPATFIFEWLSHRSDELETIATGATFKEITKTAFKRFPFTRPDVHTLAAFSRLTDPIEEEIAVAESHNRRLAATRDLLLARLVTGRLDISDIDLGELLPARAA